MRLCFVVLPLYFGGPTLSCILHICSSSLLLSKPLCFCFAHAHMMPLQYPPHCHCYPFSFAHTLLLSCYSFLCTTPASSFMQSFLFPFMQSFPFAFANSRHCGFVRSCFISFCVVFLLPCALYSLGFPSLSTSHAYFFAHLFVSHFLLLHSLISYLLPCSDVYLFSHRHFVLCAS